MKVFAISETIHRQALNRVYRVALWIERQVLRQNSIPYAVTDVSSKRHLTL